MDFCPLPEAEPRAAIFIFLLCACGALPAYVAYSAPMYLTSSSITVGQHCFARDVRLGDTKERFPTEVNVRRSGRDVRRSDLGDLVGDGRDVRRSDLGDIEGRRSTDT